MTVDHALLLLFIVLAAGILLALHYVRVTQVKGTLIIMSTLDDLKTQYDQLKLVADQSIAALHAQSDSIASLNARITGLEQQLATPDGVTEQTLRSVIADMRDETAKMVAAIPGAVAQTADPAPTPVPAATAPTA